jgi:hypothetical protein
VRVSVSSRPSRSEDAAPGCERSSSEARTRRPSSASAWSSLAQAHLDRGAVALGQVIEDAAFLVANAALHRDRAEHLADCGAQRLGSVEHDEHALLDVKSAVHEV